MFKQRRKDRTRSTECTKLKHIFPKNKGKCLCQAYYKVNGRIFRSEGNGRAFGEAPRVVGTTADFHYKNQNMSEKQKRRYIKKITKIGRKKQNMSIKPLGKAQHDKKT